MTEMLDSDLDFASASMILRRANRFFPAVSRLSTAVAYAMARRCLAKDVLRDADRIQRFASMKGIRKTRVECKAEAVIRRLPMDPPPCGEFGDVSRPQTDDDLLSLHRPSRMFPESDHVVVRVNAMAAPRRGEDEDR